MYNNNIPKHPCPSRVCKVSRAGALVSTYFTSYKLVPSTTGKFLYISPTIKVYIYSLTSANQQSTLKLSIHLHIYKLILPYVNSSI